MAFGKWGRRALAIGAAPFTGGLSLAGLAPDLPNSVKDPAKSFLLGQKPGDVQLSQGYLDAQAGRRDAIGALRGTLAGINPEEQAIAAEQAAMRRGALAASNLGAQQQSQAAGVRGFGALGAMQSAAANSAAGGAQINAQASAQAAADRLGALTSAQRTVLQGQGMLLGAEQQAMQQALMEEEWRRQNARTGALGAITGTLGTGIGGALGGPQGAAAGGQLGSGLGNAALSAWGYG